MWRYQSLKFCPSRLECINLEILNVIRYLVCFCLPSLVRAERRSHQDKSFVPLHSAHYALWKLSALRTIHVNFIDLSPIHWEIIAFQFVAEIIKRPVTGSSVP